jgi:Alpha/beta hydrolase of unknown function (DUF1400)
MSLSIWLSKSMLFLALSTGLVLCCGEVKAAEKVVLKYSVLQVPISVSELETFGKTGQMSPPLALLLTQSKQNPDTVRQALTKQIKVNYNLVKDNLKSTPAKLILDQVGQVIHPPTNQRDRDALGNAVLKSLEKDNQLTLLEVMQNYPTSEIQVDGDRLVEAYTQLATFAQQLGNLPNQLKDILNRFPIPRL